MFQDLKQQNNQNENGEENQIAKVNKSVPDNEIPKQEGVLPVQEGLPEQVENLDNKEISAGSEKSAEDIFHGVKKIDPSKIENNPAGKKDMPVLKEAADDYNDKKDDESNEKMSNKKKIIFISLIFLVILAIFSAFILLKKFDIFNRGEEIVFEDKIVDDFKQEEIDENIEETEIDGWIGSENIEDGMDGDIEDGMDGDIEDGMDGDIDIEDGMDGDIENEMDGDIENEMDGDIENEMDGYIEDGMDGYIEDGMDGDIEDGMDGDIEDGMDGYIEDEMDGYIEDGMDGDIDIEDGMDGDIGESIENGTLDTDNDGLLDIEEEKLGTSSQLSDTDEDGLEDGEEINIYKTDPLDPDTDKDGYLDGQEVDSGYNPKGEGKLIEI